MGKLYRLISFLLLVNTSLAAAGDCGPGVGSCDPGWCCSESGRCGQTEDYCKGPQCQLAYSDSCDTYFPPPGESTANIPRPKIGSVPYGVFINKCANPGQIALTYDDGPWIYTDMMLDVLDSFNVKATFFISGNNLGKGRMDDPAMPWPGVMRRMYASGHHIASHSWTHQDLTIVSSAVQQSEIIYNEMAFRNLFGWIPTYFRCPYLLCDTASGSLTRLADLGYHVIDMNPDTKDYENNDASLVQISKNRFANGVSLNPAVDSYIPLTHDIHYQTVVNLTAYMINTLRSRGYTPVTVGECLNDPPANWYRDAGGASSSPSTSNPSTLSIPTSSSSAIPPVGSSSSSTTASSTLSTTPSSSVSSPSPSSALIASPNQSCGGTAGYPCRSLSFGNCCSYYGFCGSTPTYCSTGCQNAFGTCAPPSTGFTVTSNGLCDPSFQASCLGYGAGQCCSASGFCGSTDAYCGAGCQGPFDCCT